MCVDLQLGSAAGYSAAWGLATSPAATPSGSRASATPGGAGTTLATSSFRSSPASSQTVRPFLLLPLLQQRHMLAVKASRFPFLRVGLGNAAKVIQCGVTRARSQSWRERRRGTSFLSSETSFCRFSCHRRLNSSPFRPVTIGN
jgi:hypothetical protein